MDDDDEDYNLDEQDYGENGRPKRKATRKAKNHGTDDDMDMYVDGNDNDSLMEIEDAGNDSEYDQSGVKMKKRGAAARKPKEAGAVGKKKRWEDAFDDEGNDNEEKKKQRQLKKEQNLQKKAARDAQKESQLHMNNPNMVKTSNKLIGEIFNQDLYNSDDSGDLNHDADANMPHQQHLTYRNDELDLGIVQKPKEKKMDFFIKKIQDKKVGDVEQQAINLGLVETLSKQVTANELAAKGIKLSIRDSIIDFIKKEMAKDQSQAKEVQNLLNVLESDKQQRDDINVNENQSSSNLVNNI